MRTFQISVFENERDNAPALHSLDWAKLCDALTQYDVRSTKSGSAWSPARFEGTRSNPNVRGVSCLVFDLDHTDPSDVTSPPPTADQLQAMAESLDAAGVACIAHESWSAGRWRLVIPLARDLAPHEFASTWANVRDAFDIPADRAAVDPARLYFAPSHPPGESRESTVSTGEFFDPDALPEKDSDQKVISLEQAKNVPEKHSDRKVTLQNHGNSRNNGITPKAEPNIFPGNFDKPKSEKGTQPDNFLANLDRPNSEKGTRPFDIEKLRAEVSSRGPIQTRKLVRAFVDCSLTLKKGERDLTLFKIFAGLYDAVTEIPDDELVRGFFKAAFARMEGSEEEDEAKWEHKFMKLAVEMRKRAEKNLAMMRALEKTLGVDKNDPTTAWRENLMTAKDKAGGVTLVNHTTNLEKILDNDDDLGAHVRFNVLRRKIEIIGGQFKGIEQETMPTRISNAIMDKYRLNLNRGDVEASLYLAASKRSYDPVREYLDDLKWDGVPRIATVLRKYCHASGNDKYIDIVSRKFFIAAAARGLRPGCQVDTTLVLHGKQGGGKTTFVREIAKCPDGLDATKGSKFHVETRIDITNKDATMTATQNWLVELSELASIRGSQIEATRAFLTNREDQIRLPYARTMVNYPRRCVFIGTTNSNTPLVDSEGNRRFWTVSVGTVDVLGLRAVVDQLWAEAVYCFREYEKVEKDFEARKQWQWWLTEEEQVTSDQENEVYRMDSPRTEQVLNWIDSCKKLPKQINVYQLARDIGYDTMQAADQRVSAGLHAALKELGWKRRKMSDKGSRLFFYTVPEEVHLAKKQKETGRDE